MAGVGGLHAGYLIIEEDGSGNVEIAFRLWGFCAYLLANCIFLPFTSQGSPLGFI